MSLLEEWFKNSGVRIKPGDRIVFCLHYFFSNNGHRKRWYQINSFDCSFYRGKIKLSFKNGETKFSFKGDGYGIIRVVDLVAESFGLDFREIETWYDIHKRMYEFVRK